MSWLYETYPGSTISQQADHTDLPERGPPIEDGHGNKKVRLVVGWRHQNDTPEATQHGRMWCEVYNGSFHVYDESYNRSPKAGEVRFCGHANFTMVRMFHPWFARVGGTTVPGDMVPADKAWCRDRWMQALAAYRDVDGRVDERMANDGEGSSGQRRRPNGGAKTSRLIARRAYRPRVDIDTDTDTEGDESPTDDSRSSDGDEDGGDENDNSNGLNMSQTSNSHANDHGNGQPTQHKNQQSHSTNSASASSSSSTTLDQNDGRIKPEPNAEVSSLTSNGNDAEEVDDSKNILATALQSFNNNRTSSSISTENNDKSLNPLKEDIRDSDPLFFPDAEDMDIEHTMPATLAGSHTEPIKIEDENDDVDIITDPSKANYLFDLYLKGTWSFPIQVD